MSEADMAAEGPLHDLTAFQRDALLVLAGWNGEPPKGTALKNELDRLYGKEVNHGRLYPNLDTLVDRGLVSKGRKDDRTNSYALTGRGRRELEAYREWVNGQVGE